MTYMSLFNVSLSPSYTLEIANAAVSVVLMFAVAVFLNYIWLKRDEGYFFLRPGIAVLMVWLGDLSLRAQYWDVRHLNNHGVDTNPNFIGVISSYALIIAAVLCCIRIFSGKHWVWIMALITAVIVSLLSPLV